MHQHGSHALAQQDTPHTIDTDAVCTEPCTSTAGNALHDQLINPGKQLCASTQAVRQHTAGYLSHIWHQHNSHVPNLAGWSRMASVLVRRQQLLHPAGCLQLPQLLLQVGGDLLPHGEARVTVSYKLQAAVHTLLFLHIALVLQT